MRSRILIGAFATVALFGATATIRGDAATPSRQSAIFWFTEPTLIVSTIVQGPVVFVHDEAKMSAGEACTSIYLWEPGKTRGDEIASFHCLRTARKSVSKFTVRTRPNDELGFGCVLKEYQFAGDTEGHALPAAARFTH